MLFVINCTRYSFDTMAENRTLDLLYIAAAEARSHVTFWVFTRQNCDKITKHVTAVHTG